MPAVATRPMRILESDHAPLRLVASLEQRTPADVIHSALDLYLERRRAELSAVFSSTQAAIQNGDLDGLTVSLEGGTKAMADALEADVASYR